MRHLELQIKKQEVGLMAGKTRVPMQVDPDFEVRIKNLQKAIMIKQGKNLSLREITGKVARMPNFDDIEKSILKAGNVDIKLNLDRRRK